MDTATTNEITPLSDVLLNAALAEELTFATAFAPEPLAKVVELTSEAIPIFNYTNNGYQLRTQKAIGFAQMWEQRVSELHIGANYEPAWVAQTVEQARYAFRKLREHYIGRAIFGRGCPKFPKHGFVESRIIKSVADAEAYAQEVFAEDPEGEIIFMYAIEAQASGIWMPEAGLLAIGPGHDGATGGHGSLMLTVPTHAVAATSLKKCAIKKDETMYVELVHGSFSDGAPVYTWPVQARSGPMITTNDDNYVPHTTVVTQVIHPTDDLLAWEKLTAELHGKAGVVAYKPGATLACHAAVHCVLHEIPFITTGDEPEVGKKLTRTTNNAFQKTVDKDFRYGAMTPHLEPLTNTAEIEAAMAVIHGTIRLLDCKHGARLIGWACATIFRSAAMACLGELRHVSKKRLDENGNKIPREKVFERARVLPIKTLARQLARVSLRFAQPGWGSGFGGWGWFNGAVLAMALYNRISEGKMAPALAEANKLIHAEHNNGWLFNKFTGNSLDAFAQQPSLHLARHVNALYRALTSTHDKAPIAKRKHRVSARLTVDHVKYSNGLVTLKLSGKNCSSCDWEKHRDTIELLTKEL